LWKKDEITTLILILLPLTFSWLYIASFVLIYVFDQVNYLNDSGILPDVNVILFFVIFAIPCAISILLTGIFIDKAPRHLGRIVSLGLFGSSIFLALEIITLKLKNGILFILALSILGAFMAILTVSSHAYYGSSIKWTQRGLIYSFAILGFEILSLLFILGTQMLGMDFFVPLAFYSVFGLIIGLIFYYHIHNREFWTNDEWPTQFKRIIKRRSVSVYYWTHFFIYFMIGLLIGGLAEAGTIFNINTFFGIELGAYKTYWAGIILGAGIFILLGGYLADKFGRKTAIIIAAYGIVLASIIIGLLKETEFIPISFFFSAIIIGISFALIHPSLDSSLWADLASRDSIGRYYSLGFLSLGTGVFSGILIGFISFLNIEDQLIFNVFVLIILAVLASLPLFWTSDSSPPLYFFLLLVINDAGMPIFHYNFKRSQDLKVDLPLISGALSAVGSFMLEATGEIGARLNLVRHGTNFIISDKGKYGISGAIFANKNDPELHGLLQKFITQFENRFSEKITSWNGNVREFDKAIHDAEEIFGPLVTIQVD
jgi:MFS family permease